MLDGPPSAQSLLGRSKGLAGERELQTLSGQVFGIKTRLYQGSQLAWKRGVNEMTQRRQEMGEEGNKLHLGPLQLEGFQLLGSYLSDNECLNHSWIVDRSIFGRSIVWPLWSSTRSSLLSSVFILKEHEYI